MHAYILDAQKGFDFHLNLLLIFCIGIVFDVTGDFRNVFYIVCVCDLVASVLMAFGICIRSKRSNKSESEPTKDNTGLAVLSKVTQVEIIPTCEKKAIAQYETAV